MHESYSGGNSGHGKHIPCAKTTSTMRLDENHIIREFDQLPTYEEDIDPDFHDEQQFKEFDSIVTAANGIKDDFKFFKEVMNKASYRLKRRLVALDALKILKSEVVTYYYNPILGDFKVHAIAKPAHFRIIILLKELAEELSVMY